ncbi:MAG: hypothetical protein L3J73_02435 [Thermoplasmata archaeon]|nr:hypothetical protein [Thermoplasmata archaeon]
MTAETIDTGLRRLVTGAGLGVAGGLLGVLLPIVFVELARYNVTTYFVFDARFFQTLSLLVVVGAVLLFLSLFLYRRAFFALRSEGGAFPFAAGMCLVGSFGFLSLLVAAILVFGSSDALSNCVSGRPTQLLSCLRANSPLGGATAVLGFWLGWVGGVGIVLGLVSSGSRFRQSAFFGGAGLYAILLLVLVGPFLALLYPVPDVSELLLTVPALLLLAPAFVFGAAGRALEAPPTR